LRGILATVRSTAFDTLARGAALRDVAALVRRRWWILIAWLLLIPSAVYAYSAGQAKTYEASVTLQLEDAATTVPGGEQLSGPTQPVTLQVWASSRPVADATVSRLHGPDRAFSGLSANVDKGTGWLILTATAATPRGAVAAANAYSGALIRYVGVNRRRAVDVEIAAARQTIALTRDSAQRRELSGSLSNMIALRETTAAPIRVVRSAEAGVASPHPMRNALLALLLAILTAPALLAALKPLDRALRKPADLERLGGAALLAGIPREAFAAARPDLAADRAFERLRDSLIYLDPDRRPRTFAIVSPLAGDGRTTVATGLAATFARAGRRVVLLDADLSSPGVAARAGVPAAPGLTEVIDGRDLDATLRRAEGFEGQLTVLPAGSPSPWASEQLGSARMSQLLTQLSERFDFVVIDTAPLLPTSGPLALVGQVPGVVALARLNHTSRDAVRRMMRIANAAGAHVVGVVATDARRERHRYAPASRPAAWRPGSSPGQPSPTR
jgi:Mrp family chromosome partitioning ATPase